MRLAPDALQRMEQMLNSGSRARYFMDRHVTKSWYLEKGREEYRIENLVPTNYLPKLIVCGLMDNDELTGKMNDGLIYILV